MSANLTKYALERVLFHLSEEQQFKQDKTLGYGENFAHRAAARVIVKRKLRHAETEVAVEWEQAKQ